MRQQLATEGARASALRVEDEGGKFAANQVWLTYSDGDVAAHEASQNKVERENRPRVPLTPVQRACKSKASV
jgi:hypothetical protein